MDATAPDSQGSLDALRKELEEKKQREADLKASNAELEQIIKDVAPIVLEYKGKSVGFLNDRRRYACYHDEAAQRVKDGIGEAGMAEVVAVVEGVDKLIDAARDSVDAKRLILAQEQDKLATAIREEAAAKDAFEQLKSRSAWLTAALKDLDTVAQTADRFEKAGKRKAAYAALLELDAGLDDLDDQIPDPTEFESKLLALDGAVKARSRVARERQAAVASATTALATAVKAYEQQVASRRKDILDRLDPTS